jgi:hypothetical protein
MGTLLRFPGISPIAREPDFQGLSQTIPDLVRQLNSFQKPAEAPLSAALAAAIDGLETALADIDAIGRLLPAGEFKTRFDLDRSVLAAQLDLAKGKLVGIYGNERDLDGHAPR